MGKCLFCGSESDSNLITCNKEDGSQNHEFLFRCPHCGQYQIPNTSLLNFVFDPEDCRINTFLVSCYLYETKDKRGNSVHRIDGDEIHRILDSYVPHTPEAKINRILNYVNQNSPFFGACVKVVQEFTYSFDLKELKALLSALEKKGFIRYTSKLGDNGTKEELQVSITLDGIEYIKEKKSEVCNDKCFIAMWFDKEVETVYNNSIKPACISSGYEPIRIDEQLYNGDVTDNILASIRTTTFTIADFTGNRGGVYYEAGFAKGLGKEVILTCRDDYFLGDERNRIERVHFDINHENFIVWKRDKEEEFENSLSNRIIATIGKGSYNV